MCYKYPMQAKHPNAINFRVEGGHKLSGEITVRTSKNGAVGVMCASLLNKGKTTIKNALNFAKSFMDPSLTLKMLGSQNIKGLCDETL